MVAIPCGHSICSNCLNSILCSSCKKRIKNYKINNDLMEILDLDLIVDPNAKLRKEIKSYFENIDQLEDQLESARNE